MPKTPAEKALRRALIHLAQKKPDIKWGSVLPILKEVGLVPVGTTVDLPRSKTRVTRTPSSVKIWDLSFAGEVGKSVLSLTICDLDYLTSPMIKQVEDWVNSLDSLNSFEDILDSARALNERTPGDKIYLKGVSAMAVAPFGFGPIEVKGDHATIWSDWNSFSVNNLCGECPTIGFENATHTVEDAHSTERFYRWLRSSEKEPLRELAFHEVISQMDRLGVKYHLY